MQLSSFAIAGFILSSAMAALAGIAMAGDKPKACIDVRIGEDRAAHLNCLNQQIARSAERAHDQPQPAAPLDARSQSTQIGTANTAAAREMMGNAFGKSAIPERPAR